MELESISHKPKSITSSRPMFMTATLKNVIQRTKKDFNLEFSERGGKHFVIIYSSVFTL